MYKYYKWELQNTRGGNGFNSQNYNRQPIYM